MFHNNIESYGTISTQHGYLPSWYRAWFDQAESISDRTLAPIISSKNDSKSAKTAGPLADAKEQQINEGLEVKKIGIRVFIA